MHVTPNIGPEAQRPLGLAVLRGTRARQPLRAQTRRVVSLREAERRTGRTLRGLRGAALRQVGARTTERSKTSNNINSGSNARNKGILMLRYARIVP